MQLRISEIYRLVRVNSGGFTKASKYVAEKQTETQITMCGLIHSVNLSNQTAFCAHGEDDSGEEGDVLVIKAQRKNGMTPVYTVGMDANHVNSKPSVFLQLYPYVDWIKRAIAS